MPGTDTYSPGMVNQLKLCCPVQNRHIMGWGATNPKPWSNQPPQLANLDGHIARMTAVANVPMITFALCPDYMRVPKAQLSSVDGATNWGVAPRDASWIEQFPSPEWEDAFIDMCVAIAVRYPAVKMFALWNENKGLWLAAGGWDSVRYNRGFNKLRAKLLAARPDAQLGGPYCFVHFGAPSYGGSEVSGSQVAGTFGRMDRFAQACFLSFMSNCAFDFWTFDCNLGNTWGGNIGPDAAVGRHGAVTGWLMAQQRKPVYCMETYPSFGDSPDRYIGLLDGMSAAAGGTPCGALLWGESNEGGKFLWSGNSPTPLATQLALRAVA